MKKPTGVDPETWRAIAAIEWLSATDAAGRLGVGCNTVTAQLRAGRLRGICSHGPNGQRCWLVPASEIASYKRRRRGAGREGGRTKAETVTTPLTYPFPSPEQ